MRSNGYDARLNLVSAGIITTRNNQDVKIQLMLFCTIYTNYNYKPLVEVRKPAISWDKFKKLASRKGLKVA